MKPAGEPDARNGHVRFDERGVETEHGSDREAQGRLTARLNLNHRATPRLY
jgi:hypothetical protein